MSKGSAILKNTLYQSTGKILGIGFGILSFSLMARYLGPADFGVYATAITFVSIFATLADLGLPVLLLRLLALKKRSDAKKIRNLHGVRVLSSFIVLGLSLLVARLMPYGSAIQKGILISVVGFLAVSLTQYLLPIFQVRLKTAWSSAAEVVGRLFMFVVVALAVYFDWGLFAVIWSSAVGSVIALTLTYFFAGRLEKIIIKFNLKSWPPLFKMASPLILITVFSLIYFKIDTLLLSVLKPIEDVGVYTAAYKFMDVFITFPALFSALALPFFARAGKSGKQDKSRLTFLYSRALKAVLMAALPLAVVTYLEAPRLIDLFAGQDFILSAQVLRILSLAVVPLFVGNLGVAALIGVGKAGRVAWFFAVNATAGSVLYFFLIKAFTYDGAAIGTVILETFMALATFVFLLTRTKKIEDLSGFLRVVAAVAGFGGLLVFMRELPLILSLTLGFSGYGLLLLLTRATTIKEIKSLLGIGLTKVI